MGINFFFLKFGWNFLQVDQDFAEIHELNVFEDSYNWLFVNRRFGLQLIFALYDDLILVFQKLRPDEYHSLTRRPGRLAHKIRHSRIHCLLFACPRFPQTTQRQQRDIRVRALHHRTWHPGSIFTSQSARTVQLISTTAGYGLFCVQSSR